jgi:IS5 family transposase
LTDTKKGLAASGVFFLGFSCGIFPETHPLGKVGKIIDATIISAPVQRNSKSENAAIKEGKRPKSFDENAAKARQKDSDARWTKKHNKSYYGYKNHAKVDLSSKLIEAYCTSAASLHDSQAAVELIEEGDGTMFADSAYVGERIANDLKKKGVHSLIHEKGTKNWPLNERQKKLNKGKSRLRARVEHVFGWQAQSAMDRVRTIGAKRARRNIGFFNLFYNFFRNVCSNIAAI